MNIKQTRYVIAVLDLESSARFYRDVLGFTIHRINDPGWLFFERDGCVIMAGECRNATPPNQLGDHSYFAYIVVDDEIDGFYEQVRAQGARICKPLRDEPWGAREFGLTTSDGHRIMFACHDDAA